MRVQFTKAENELIETRRGENTNFDGIVVPVEGQGEQITLGIEISDVHKFNMFITNWLQNQDNSIINEIGGKIVHIDYRAPIKAEYLIFLKNYIDGALYGPTPDPVPEEEPQQEILHEEEEENYLEEEPEDNSSANVVTPDTNEEDELIGD